MNEANELPEVTDEGLQPGTEEVQVEPTDENTPPASAEETEPSEATDETDETPVEQTPKKPTGFQKRVQKLHEKAALAEQEAQYWRQLALQSNREATSQPSSPLKLENFNTVEEFIEARETQLRQQLLAEVQETVKATTASTKLATEYELKVREARTSLPDWEEVMQAAHDEPTTPETVQFCLDSDIGPRIAYHLAKNPEFHERLNSMSPVRRIAELGKLEDRLKAPKQQATKTVTSAPTKLPTVKGSATVVNKDPGQASSYTEWKKLNEARKAALSTAKK